MLTRFKKRTRPSPKWVAISCFATEREKEINIFCILNWFLKLEFRGWVSLLEMCIKSSYETKSLKPISVHSREILILLLFRFKSCHRYWQRGLKRFGDVECLDEEKGKKKLGNPRRRKVTKNSTIAPTRRGPAGATTTTAGATNRTRTGQHEICKVFQTSRFC